MSNIATPEDSKQVNREGVFFRLLAWFASNPVAANLLMLLIFVGGAVSLYQIQKQVYPRFNSGWIKIAAAYPGAGPAEIAEGVCVPIEEAIHDLPGIKRIETQAIQGSCEIWVWTLPTYDVKALLSDLRGRTLNMRTLPKAVERIEIEEDGWEYDAIAVVLHGHTDALTLRQLGERVREDLTSIPGIRRIVPMGKVAYEISIEVSPERLQRHGMSLAELAEAIRRSSLDLPGGVIRTPSGELLLRAKGRASEAAKLNDIVIRTLADGTRLRLGDVASIRDGLEDQQRYESFLSGEPAVVLGVKVQDDVVNVARQVQDYVTKLQQKLPEGIHATTRRDNSRSFEDRLYTLVENGIQGFVFVFIVLLLFLRTRIAFWAGVGILISIFGTLWWMPAAGVTLNMISLFGFLLAMGILVDDAIIIGEQVHALQAQGVRGLAGAIRGVQEVGAPVILAVVIGLVAFLPGLFIYESWATQMVKPLAVVMMLSLLFSLVESLLILPAHLAHDSNPNKASGPSWLQKIRSRLNAGMETVITRWYVPFLRGALDWRYATLALFLTVMGLVGALVWGGYVKVSLVQDATYDTFHVHVTPPPGTPYAVSQARVQQMLQALDQAEAELKLTQPGLQKVLDAVISEVDEVSSTLWVEFSREARSRFALPDLLRVWRRKIGDAGFFDFDFHTPTEQDVIDVDVVLSSPDLSQLSLAADDLKAKISNYAGIFEVKDSRKPGKPEIRLQLRPEAERLGLRLKDIAEQVRQAYYGEEVHRFMRGRDEVKVMVRFNETARRSLDDLNALPINLPSGSKTPLGTLATAVVVPGFADVTRQNRRQTINVQARVSDGAAMDGEAIYKDLEKNYFSTLEHKFPGLRIGSNWVREENDRVAQSLKRNTLLAIAVIYVLIAVPFRSYLQPFIFMVSVPVAWTGAVFMHWVLGLDLSFESVIGLVAASGVVVNDSIVLLDYLSQHGQEDKTGRELITDACAARFRPIMLVSLTNLAGFLPTLLESSEQAKFLGPMTLSLASGLLFGMTATLLLTPVCCAILEDLQPRRRLAPATLESSP